MTPSPDVSWRPGLVVIRFVCGCVTWLPPDSARRMSAALARAADDSEGKGRRPRPRLANGKGAPRG